MSDITISIIIPVYNVNNYIETCLNSVINQNYNKLEIILIDDCGNDNSIELAKNIIAKQSNHRTKIIKHEKNKGLSAARNTGIKNANGDYVLFLDSDDYLTPNAIEYFIETYKKYPNIDFIIGGVETIGLKNIAYPLLCNEHVNNKINVITSFLNREWYVMAWNKLINKNFLQKNNLWFKEGIFHEDLDFTFRLAHSAEAFACCYNITYKYLIREGSITTKKISKNYIDEKNIILGNCQMLTDDIKIGIKDTQIGNYITYTCFNYIYNVIKDKKLHYKEKKIYINDIIGKRKKNKLYNSCSGKNKIISIILNTNIIFISIFVHTISLLRIIKNSPK